MALAAPEDQNGFPLAMQCKERAVAHVALARTLTVPCRKSYRAKRGSRKKQ
jgi:hypothetical protein